jgi:hypothetical protein
MLPLRTFALFPLPTVNMASSRFSTDRCGARDTDAGPATFSHNKPTSDSAVTRSSCLLAS